MSRPPEKGMVRKAKKKKKRGKERKTKPPLLARGGLCIPSSVAPHWLHQSKTWLTYSDM